MCNQIQTLQEIQHVCMANNNNLLSMLALQKLPGHLSGDKCASVRVCVLFPVLATESNTL